MTPALADLPFTAAGKRYVACVYAPTEPGGDWVTVAAFRLVPVTWVEPEGVVRHGWQPERHACGYATVDAAGRWELWSEWPIGTTRVARRVAEAWWNDARGRGREGGG